MPASARPYKGAAPKGSELQASCCEPSGTQRTQRAGTVPKLLLSERGDAAKEPQGVSCGTCWPAQHCLQGQAHEKS